MSNPLILDFNAPNTFKHVPFVKKKQTITPEKRLKDYRKYYKNNKENVSVRKKKYYLKNKEQKKAELYKQKKNKLILSI